MKELKFVDVGEGITEGHIQRWLVKDGDTVREDQPVVQIETDKAIVNIPSPINGTIKINAKENSDVDVGDTLAYIGEENEIRELIASVQQKGIVEVQTAPTPTPEPREQKEEEILATPSVRKLARDLNVELKKIAGTGPNGRIIENDVRNFAREAQQARHKATIPKFSETLEETHGEEVERMPMSQTRKAIARNMELSWTIPRATHMDMINATRLYKIVQGEKANMESRGIRLTFTPFIIKAVIEALKESPRFNSSLDHEKNEIILKRYYNIGLAAEGPDGLKIIVIKNADRKSIAEIAREVHELSEKVRSQTIALDEMHDSTFTITNIGSLGGGFLSVPMINPPEVAILGVHLIKDMPIVENNQVRIAKVLPFSLVFDHRVVDGADAVLFGNTLKRYLEDPDFLEMLG